MTDPQLLVRMWLLLRRIRINSRNEIISFKGRVSNGSAFFVAMFQPKIFTIASS